MEPSSFPKVLGSEQFRENRHGRDLRWNCPSVFPEAEKSGCQGGCVSVRLVQARVSRANKVRTVVEVKTNLKSFVGHLTGGFSPSLRRDQPQGHEGPEP